MSNTQSLHSVDLNLLVALDLLLEERSVRGAARRAHVTPSAMSHTLSRLRELFDDELLVRSGRQMLPTARAEALAEPLRQVLAQTRELLDPGHPVDPAGLQRRFRLVCTDHVATVLLPALEERLAREAPDVDLLVSPLVPDTMSDLRKGLVDVAIGVFPDAPPEVRQRRLFEDRFVTVARQGHPRLSSPAPDLEAWLAERHVLVAPRGDPRGLVDEVLEAQGRSRRVARAFPVFLSALWHVAHSDDLLTVSQRLVDTTRHRFELQVMAPPVELPPYSMVMAWHPRTDRSPEDAWLRGLLVQVAAALPPL